MDGCIGGAEFEAAFEMSQTVEIPLLGAVAAGEPYHAFAVDDTLTVPTTLWGGKEVFALRVRGTSMIDEGIHNGDYLIVEPRAAADNGQTVVAEIDGAVTVKKFYREPDGAIRLQPANPDMLPLIVRGKQVRIIGVVTGILRKFGFGERAATGRPDTPAAPRPRPVRASCARLHHPRTRPRWNSPSTSSIASSCAGRRPSTRRGRIATCDATWCAWRNSVATCRRCATGAPVRKSRDCAGP